MGKNSSDKGVVQLLTCKYTYSHVSAVRSPKTPSGRTESLLSLRELLSDVKETRDERSRGEPVSHEPRLGTVRYHMYQEWAADHDAKVPSLHRTQQRSHGVFAAACSPGGKMLVEISAHYPRQVTPHARNPYNRRMSCRATTQRYTDPLD